MHTKFIFRTLPILFSMKSRTTSYMTLLSKSPACCILSSFVCLCSNTLNLIFLTLLFFLLRPLISFGTRLAYLFQLFVSENVQYFWLNIRLNSYFHISYNAVKLWDGLMYCFWSRLHIKQPATICEHGEWFRFHFTQEQNPLCTSIVCLLSSFQDPFFVL